MGLLSFFQRRNGPADASPRLTDAPDAIAAARTRARRRLMGAAVLLMAGVIGFPLVFETQPRPVPVDIPIEIPRKDGAPALSMPPARPVAAQASAPTPAATAIPAPAAPIAEAPRVQSAPAASAPANKASSAEPPKKVVAEAKPAAAASVPAPAVAESARAKALLEGKDSAKSAASAKPEPAREGGRFVVQVGAFADAAAAREMRGRVEKLGLKSYMQVVETSTGSRTRVRAGPFESRDEAEKAMAKAKAAGLNAVVLTL
jgi:DedD protein